MKKKKLKNKTRVLDKTRQSNKISVSLGSLESDEIGGKKQNLFPQCPHFLLIITPFYAKDRNGKREIEEDKNKTG